jgi:hypothetical protein
MEFWVVMPMWITSWLRLVVGLPRDHAEAVEEFAKMTFDVDLHKARSKKDGKKEGDDEDEEEEEDEYREGDRLKWWYGTNLNGRGQCLPLKYVNCIHDAIFKGMWVPNQTAVQKWSKDDIKLWAMVALSLPDDRAERLAATIRSGARLVDKTCLAMLSPDCPAFSKIKDGDFSLGTLPCIEFCVETLVRGRARGVSAGG